MTDEPSPESGYRLLRRRHSGCWPEVWEATSPQGAPVEIAIHPAAGDDPARYQRLLQSLELWKVVSHPLVRPLHAIWVSGGLLYVVTEPAPDTLWHRLRDHRRAGGPGVPAPELLSLLGQAAEALDYLNAPRHPVGGQLLAIRHCDIKPENIVVLGGVARIAGLDRAQAVEGDTAAAAEDSGLMSLHCSAPELYRGQVTAWTDQYALAITYFKLRTGEFPFDARGSAAETGRAIVGGRLTFDAVGEAERGVLRRATRLQPEKRFPTCAEFIKALWRATADDGQLAAGPAGRTGPTDGQATPSPQSSWGRLLRWFTG